MELERTRWGMSRKYSPSQPERFGRCHGLPVRSGSAPVNFASSELLLASPFLSSSVSNSFDLIR